MIRNVFMIATVVAISLLSACTQRESKSETITSQAVDSTSVEYLSAPGFRFYILSDWGFNGYYDQTNVANAMVRTAEVASPKLIVSCGDNFQTNGVRSTSDPLWKTNFEEVYQHPIFNVDWFPVLGNHDYKGSTQAEIDYSLISRRWNLPAHYYTFTRKINDSIQARFIFLDTPALLSEYRDHPEEYPDAIKQDSTKQIQWLHDVLKQSNDDWILVFGHHPLYSASSKHGSTPELIHRLKPLFDKYGVDFYFSGHDHDFQYLKPEGSRVHYIVTGTGGKIRESESDQNTVFNISRAGFTLISMKGDELKLQFIGTPGNVVYQTVINSKHN